MKAAGSAETFVLIYETVLRHIIQRPSSKPVFHKLCSAKPQVSANECQGFRQTKMHNGGRVLLAFLNLYVRIQIRVATFDTSHSVTDGTHLVAASIHKFRHSALNSVSRARQRQCRYVRRDDQVVDQFEVGR
jgi:hypothetical protein